MFKEKLIKNQHDITKNLIFAPAMAKVEFREKCQEHLSWTPNKDDFVNIFSVQYM